MNRYEFYGNINTYRKNQTNKENELIHYGTLGQKWGVRKWQNPDDVFTVDVDPKSGKVSDFTIV